MSPLAGSWQTSRAGSTRAIETPLGTMIACATDAGITRLSFGEAGAGAQESGAGDHHLDALERELGEYFAAARAAFTVALAPAGPAFNRRVWDALRRIPAGQTKTYGEVARELGSPGGQRAVGRANHDNPIAILIPCHRVVASDGSPHGYAGGLWRKRWLLDLEAGQRSLASVAGVGGVAKANNPAHVK